LEFEDVEDFNVDIGDFVLVTVHGKKINSFKHYVAEVVGKKENEFEVHYMKRIQPSYAFIFEEADIYTADSKDIVRKLPKPNVLQGTRRTMTKLTFAVDFLSYNVH